MRELLRQRHAANERLAPARVLNLIVIVDREWKGEITNRLERAGRYHGSRTILCTVTEGRTTLDATARVSYDNPEDKLGVMWEKIEIDIGPQHLPSAADDHRPDRRLGVADRAVVAASPRRRDSGAAAADRRDPARLRRLPVGRRRVRAGVLGPRPRVRDRSRLAAHDSVARAAGGELRPAVPAAGAAPCQRAQHPPPRRIKRLGAPARRVAGIAAGLGAGAAGAARRSTAARAMLANGDGEVKVVMRESHQEAPGLAGVTVSAPPELSLSLERGWGGLDATERLGDGTVKQWKILGASRGEGGILGDGIRQALLREPTYWPALNAARELCNYERLGRRRRRSGADLRPADARRAAGRAPPRRSCSPAGPRRRPPTSVFADAVRDQGVDLLRGDVLARRRPRVPPDDDRSNYKMIKSTLLDPLADVTTSSRCTGSRASSVTRRPPIATSGCCARLGMCASTCCCSGSAPTGTRCRCFPASPRSPSAPAWSSASRRRDWSRSCRGSRSR